MGIRLLNTFLRENSRNGRISKHLSELRNKKIVVDTSIYLYQGKAEGDVTTYIRRLVNLFRQYQIEPIFIFDGKPPDEKLATLERRQEEKNDAAVRLEELWNKMKAIADDDDDETKKILENQIKDEQKKCLHITNADIRDVKLFLDDSRLHYMVAPGEADAYCAKMVIQRRVWACLSQDMDLLVYGCGRVLRDLDLDTERVFLYHLPTICKEMRVSFDEFRDVCILSGTDYNHFKMNIFKSLKLLHQYQKRHTILDEESFCMSFEEWLNKNRHIPVSFKIHSTKLFYEESMKKISL
jgi:5'-3' exonuclease